MNLQQFEYVIAVSELRSFQKAADKCFITQSTLSTMVAKLEEELGIIIFNRKTKPVTVTEEGSKVIRQLKIISKEIDNLHEVVSELKGEIKGSIKIGVIPTISPYLLPLFLNDFVNQFPAVQFEISELTTDKITELITTRDLDIGILSTPLNLPEIREVHLYNEPFLIYDRLKKPGKSRSAISDLDFSRLWLLDEGHCMRTQVESICGLKNKRDINQNLEYKSGSIDTLMKFVKSNNGITLLPYLATMDFSEEDRKQLSKIQDPVPVRSIGLVVHQHFVKNNILELLKKDILRVVQPILKRKVSSNYIITSIYNNKI